MLIPDEPDAVLKCLINRERILIITFLCFLVPSDEFRGTSLTPIPKLQITEIFYTWHSLSFCDFSPTNNHFFSIITTYATANLAASIYCPGLSSAADSALPGRGQTHTSLCIMWSNWCKSALLGGVTGQLHLLKLRPLVCKKGLLTKWGQALSFKF